MSERTVSESPLFESPIVRAYPTADERASLKLRDLSWTTKLLIRAGSETVAAGQIGITFGASKTEQDILIAGQRPEEFLLLGSDGAAEAYAEGLDRRGHVSVIDHTHSRALFQLSGAAASQLLEKVCSVDWSDAMMPTGAVVSSSVAKVGCDIIRRDSNGQVAYLIACDRSFGQYLFDALLDAGTEFDISVA